MGRVDLSVIFNLSNITECFTVSFRYQYNENIIVFCISFISHGVLAFSSLLQPSQCWSLSSYAGQSSAQSHYHPQPLQRAGDQHPDQAPARGYRVCAQAAGGQPLLHLPGSQDSKVGRAQDTLRMEGAFFGKWTRSRSESLCPECEARNYSNFVK